MIWNGKRNVTLVTTIADIFFRMLLLIISLDQIALLIFMKDKFRRNVPNLL